MIVTLGGEKEDFIVMRIKNLCALQTAEIKVLSLFTSISDKTQPVATKLRGLIKIIKILLKVKYHSYYRMV